jgi:hypothetical protein
MSQHYDLSESEEDDYELPGTPSAKPAPLPCPEYNLLASPLMPCLRTTRSLVVSHTVHILFLSS